MRFDEIFDNRRIQALCQQVPHAENWVKYGLWYADTVASDICPNVSYGQRLDIARACVNSYCYVRSLDNLIDKLNRKHAIEYLHVVGQLSDARAEFQRLLIPPFDERGFDDLWESTHFLGIQGMQRRLQHEQTDIHDLWEMSASLLLTPIACIATKHYGTDGVTPQMEKEFQTWRLLVKHHRTANQILDDIIDLLEDAEEGTHSTIRECLNGVKGTNDFVSHLRLTIAKHADIAIHHLQTAKQLAVGARASNWKNLCDSLLDQASQLTEQTLAELR